MFKVLFGWESGFEKMDLKEFEWIVWGWKSCLD